MRIVQALHWLRDTIGHVDDFATTALRPGATLQNVEKDFWVRWAFDALFKGLSDRPCLLLMGGTSLSDGFGLIKRFSEDIHVTVFRDDLVQTSSIKELNTLSDKKRMAAYVAKE